MKNRTHCKIIASRPQRSSIISKTNSDGIPFAVLLVPPTPASVGGVRKQESCYNVNCELSDEAHCHASCCALGVPLHRPAFTAEARPTDPEPPTPAADARQSISWSLFFFGSSQTFRIVHADSLQPRSRSSLAQQAVLSARYIWETQRAPSSHLTSHWERWWTSPFSGSNNCGGETRPHLFLTCGVGGDAAVGKAVATWTGAILLIPVLLQTSVCRGRTFATSDGKPADRLTYIYTIKPYFQKVAQLLWLLSA